MKRGTILFFICLLAAGCNGRCSSDKMGGKSGRGPNVVLIVTDTVRADHTSLCGYKHPTTSNFERFAKLHGATHTCDAVAPGSWTVPSHASFFTGVDPTIHRTHSIVGKLGTFDGWGSHNRTLDKTLPTLAEKMNAKGYITAAYSANPVVSDSMGLLRGFQHKQVSKDWYQFFGADFGRGLVRFMKKLPTNKPMFLFINIADAHQPWQPVPEGIAWASPAPKFSYPKQLSNSFWRKYVERRTTPDESAAGLKRVTEQYDHSMYIADRNLGTAVDWLEENNWCDWGCRFIVVSDHGEFLGEHFLLDHGHYVYNPMVRVPIVAWGFDEPIKFPEPVSATEVFNLVLEGKLTEKPLPVTSMAWPHTRRCHHTGGKAFCSTSAAIWNGDKEKLLFMDDKYYTINLKKDPAEASPTPISAHKLLGDLKSIAKRVVKDRPDTAKEIDTEAVEQLRALGYLN